MAMEHTKVPSYGEFIRKAFVSYKNNADGLDSDIYSYPGKFIDDVKENNQVTQLDIFLVVFCAVGWTLLRSYLTKEYFLPFAKNVKMLQSNIEKFPESAWKLLWYTGSWVFSCYILFYCGQYDYFYRPLQIWEGWTSTSEVPMEIYIAYLMQMSYYVHSVYGTIYMDQWRKDSIVMLIHHFLTMSLIGFSFAIRYHKIGMVVLFLHDVSDICLEFSKCNVYMKTRNNQYDTWADRLSTLGFISFASTWFVFRLYWFPLKVLYSTSYGVTQFHEHAVPFYFIFNALLWALLCLHVYWFIFIVSLSIKILSGNLKLVEDCREFDTETGQKTPPPHRFILNLIYKFITNQVNEVEDLREDDKTSEEVVEKSHKKSL